MNRLLSLRTLTLSIAILFSMLTFSQAPTNWEGDTGISIFKESTLVYQGNYSCGIEVNTPTQADCDLSNIIEIPVVAGETFSMSFWFFTSEHVRLRAAFDWNAGSATYSDNYAGPTSTGNWEEFVFEGVVPADVTAVNLRIRSYDVTGFVAPETQFVDGVTFESPVGNALTVANGDFETWPVALPEPANYPTAFEATAIDQQIALIWEDATGVQLPDAYLILANDNNNFTPPADGNFVANDLDFSDGQGATNVAFGQQAFTFFNLNAETTYYFRIFSYTNTGNEVDYKNDGTAPSASATTAAIEPEIIVTEPQTGDTWFRGNEYNVVWEIANIPGNVLIEIAEDASSGNPEWQEMVTVAASSGSYPWLVPADYSIGNDFQFRVSSLETPAMALSGIFAIMDAPDLYNIIINEIMYNSPGDDNEWCEIYNGEDFYVDLEGYYFLDSDDAHTPLIFPAGYSIAPGQYFTISLELLAAPLFFVPDFEGNALWSLGNSGDNLRLFDPTGQLVSDVNFTDSSPWPTEPDGNGPTLSLLSPMLDNSLPENWAASLEENGTPGMLNFTTDPLIQINYPNGGENLQQGASCEITWNYIELSETVDIELLKLSGSNEILATNISVYLQSWQWDIPESQALGNDYKIKITSNSNPAVSDESDDVFSIVEPVDVPLIVINEIMYNPPDALGLDDHWEYLEIYNNDDVAVDLSEWSFTQGIDFVFPSGTIIGIGEYLVIARVPDTIAAYYGISNLIGPFDGGALNNAGETVEISDQSGNVVDVVSYLDVEPWPVEPDGTGPSLSLIDPDYNNNLPESWEASIVLYGTPGLLNNSEEPFLQVIFPNGGETLLKEMSYNITWNFALLSGTVSIELTSNAGASLILAENIDIALKTWNWQIPASQAVGNDYKIAISSNENPDYTDESDAVFSIAEIPEVPNLVITEIMYNPPESGTDSLEFIEIYNNDALAINLAGFSFGSGIEYTFPSITLNAGAYLLVAVDSIAMQNTFEVAAWQWSSGGLNNGGELIALLDNFDNLVDAVEYADQLPWDTLADGDGPSLVLCNPDDDNSLPENWLTSAELAAINDDGNEIFATPGGPCIITRTEMNITQNDLVIYPNPNHGIFTLRTGQNQNSIIEIYSLSGNKVFSIIMNSLTTIDVSNRFYAGIYFIKIINQYNHTVSVQKMIIQ